MSRREKSFSLGLMVVFLSMPLYMSYLPASRELFVYCQDTPGIRGFFLWIPKWLTDAGLGVQAACKLYVFGMNLLTCLVSYGCFGKMVSGKVSALTGSIFYSFSIYSVNIRYREGSMGEMAAYALLPLCLYGFCLIYQNDRAKLILKGTLFMVAGCVGVLYAHVPLALIVLFFWVAGWVIMGKKSLQRVRVAAFLAGCGGSVLLGLPVLLPYVRAVSQGVFYIHDNQLFSARGLEIAELLTTFLRNRTAMEETVSYLSLGLPFVIVAMVCFVGRSSFFKQAGRRINQLLLAVGLSLVLSLRIFPWDMLLALLPDSLEGFLRTGLEHVGYPHRFLIIAVLLLSFGAALLADGVEKWAETEQKEHKGLILGALLVIVIALSVCSGVYYMNHLIYRIPMEEAITRIKDSWWLESEFLLYISK